MKVTLGIDCYTISEIHLWVAKCEGRVTNSRVPREGGKSFGVGVRLGKGRVGWVRFGLVRVGWIRLGYFQLD